VLYAERRLREQPKTKKDAARALEDAADMLVKVGARGIPRTSEAFDYAVSLVRRLKNLEELSLKARKGLDELDGFFDNAIAVYRTGGLFSSFSGLPPDMDPDSLWREGTRTGIEIAKEERENDKVESRRKR
jgi:hypothetical protein